MPPSPTDAPLPPVIAITGAGSGIGRATAQLFLANGWRTVLIGRRAHALHETAAAAPLGQALILPCDVTTEAEVEAGFATIRRDWGRLDVLFNNAGISGRAAPLGETALADWRAVTEVGITGMFLCARAAFRAMQNQNPQGGRIINNGSISAHVPRPGMTAYTMAKHAVTGLTRSAALDGRPFAIACGQIDIGNALTGMVSAMPAGVPQADGSIRPEPVMPVTEVARAVWHMATMPEGANVQFMTVMATNMPFIGRG